jgi:glucitol operon activator protein
MQYIFLVVAVAWALQFVLAYWQLQRFHRRIAELRKLGRCAVGLHGDRLRGRTYAVVVLDANDRVRQVETFSGWTVLSKLQPVEGLAGMALRTITSTTEPPPPLRRAQWLAIQHAATFFNTQSAPRILPTTPTDPIDAAEPEAQEGGSSRTHTLLTPDRSTPR